MAFQNLSIDVSNLPAVEGLRLQRPDPALLRVSVIGVLIFFGIMLIGVAGIFGLSEIETSPLLAVAVPGAWLIFLIISVTMAFLGFKFMGYALRQHDVVFRRGVIFRSLVTVPFNRIQHCEIKEGPVERIFGLKTLEIFTAGGQSSDVSIPGLKGETAQKLKDFIIKNTGQISDEEE